VTRGLATVRLALGIAVNTTMFSLANALRPFLVANFLFGVAPTDVVTYGAVSVILTAVASGAICIPALRAARVEPSAALRVA
jgi:ABC-type antimicrobial peptide transport system permease subunit